MFAKFFSPISEAHASDENADQKESEKNPSDQQAQDTQTQSASSKPDRQASSSNLPSDSDSMELKSKLFVKVADVAPSSSNKVTIVGTGMVGMACAISMLTQNVSSDVALVDVNEDKVRGELLDLQHGSAFLKSARISAGTDFALSSNSKVIVVCAGARQKQGDTRLNLLERNLAILKGMIPDLVKYSPNAIFLLVSNPVDILTYITWKLSGLPPNRIIGAGTNLDTSRFRFLISQKLGIAPESCHGYIIGEHGDSSVAVWSGVNIAGVQIRDLNPNLGSEDDPDHWNQIHKDVINSAYQIIKLKGYTSWAIGLSVANLTQTIMRNSLLIHAVSTNVKGLYGIENDIYLSLPCVLGENGINRVVKQPLTDAEITKLRQSANIMQEYITKLGI